MYKGVCWVSVSDVFSYCRRAPSLSFENHSPMSLPVLWTRVTSRAWLEVRWVGNASVKKRLFKKELHSPTPVMKCARQEKALWLKNSHKLHPWRGGNESFSSVFLHLGGLGDGKAPRTLLRATSGGQSLSLGTTSGRWLEAFIHEAS